MTRWFVYKWGKPNSKNPTEWFSGHHSRNSTIITTSGYKQGISSILPTYSWTLIPIPNRTCFVVTVSLSDARLPSTWLTVARILIRDFKNTNLKRLLAAKFFSSPTWWRSERCLVTKPFGANTQQLLQEKEMNQVKNLVSGHNLFEQSLLNACAICIPFDDF